MATRSKHPVPEGFHTVTPVLTLDYAGEAIEWYKKGLGAQEVSRSAGPDGKIMHAEIRIGNSPVMVNDAIMGAKGPKALGGSPASLWIYVDDSDKLFDRAIKAGGRPAEGPMGQMSDQFWGDRCGMFTDPYGYRWTIATRKEDVSRPELETRMAAFMKEHSPQPAHS
jgi:uncharacterized glyoxalase superfamily protein PhnB